MDFGVSMCGFYEFKHMDNISGVEILSCHPVVVIPSSDP